MGMITSGIDITTKKQFYKYSSEHTRGFSFNRVNQLSLKQPTGNPGI